MLLDALLAFIPAGTPVSLVAAAGVDIPSTNVVDLLGAGEGTLVTNIWGNSTLPGQADAMGVGNVRPELVVAMGAAAVAGAGTATLNVQLQAAPDNGSGSAGTWQVLGESGELTIAQLTAATIIARLPWLPPFPVNLRPRFLRLNFAIPAGTDFSAGTIAFAQVTQARDDWFVGQAAKNYTMGPLS